GSSCSTCCAASSPSFTSSAGLYRFAGATICVWATVVTTYADMAAAISIDFRRVRDMVLTPPARPWVAACPDYCGNRATKVAGIVLDAVELDAELANLTGYDARMRLLPFLVAIAAGLLAAQPVRAVLAFGHVWDGTKMLDDVIVTVEGGKI